MIEGSLLDVLVTRASVELGRVAAVRPQLKARCERACGILEAHAASPRSGVISAQLRGGGVVGFRVRSADPARSGRRYRVEAEGSWPCSCPDGRPGARHRRRDSSKACKHGLAAWALWRAASAAPSPAVSAVVAAVEARRKSAAAGPEADRLPAVA